MPKNIKPELLAPAGNLECAVTAFENGADAVYAGLHKFNAREKSDNFSFSDMAKLSGFAKKHKKKVYLTLNTLVKERELEEVYRDLETVSGLGVDAVIVQDIGVVKLIRDFFPELKIHASTQMGIHNSAGVLQAEAMGISRVILERQVTIDELEIISSGTSTEIEVFVHGALCCSLSGNCLFSSWIGGWSGNRGKCKQPCRRRYHSRENGNGFFFSTNDLYTLDLIPRLKRMNIASFKIEGRLKKADYVGRTVSAYRMMIDAGEDMEREVLSRAKNILAGSAGRKWSPGFYTEESLKTVVNHTSAGVSGSLCGEVRKVTEDGIVIRLSRELKEEDIIRIQPRSGDEGPRITVTAMETGGRRTRKAKRGISVKIPYAKGQAPSGAVSAGALVYKVGEKPRGISTEIEKLEEIEKIRAFNIRVEISEKGFTVTYKDFPGAESWENNAEIERAVNNGLSRETVINAFRATGHKTVKAGNMEVKIDGSLFLPSSTLKKIKREFWNHTAELKDTLLSEENSARNIGSFISVHFKNHRITGNTSRKADGTKTVMTETRRKKLPGGLKADIISHDIFSTDYSCGEITLPVFTPEKHLARLKSEIGKAYKKGIRRFRIRSLYQLGLLKEYDGIFITAAYPLPVSNSFAAGELKSQRAGRVQAWVELDRNALGDFLDYSPLPVEIYRYGRPHILATRAEIKTEGHITDSHGVEFIIRKNSNEEMTYLYGKKVMAVPPAENTDECFDLTNAEYPEKDTTDFNYSKEWI